jgi:hypothetical protein
MDNAKFKVYLAYSLHDNIFKLKIGKAKKKDIEEEKDEKNKRNGTYKGSKTVLGNNE